MTVIPGNYDFTIYQGSSFSKVITWRDGANNVMNLTGYTARMQIRQRLTGDILIELTTANGRISLGGTAGTITLEISAADTSAITLDGVYDLELVSGSGIVSRLLQGSVTLSKEVTR